MAEVARFTPEELIRLAGSAVAKIDLLGERGTTLCTCNEIEAMAVLVVMSGVLPGHPSDPHRQPLYPEKERTKS